MVSHALLLKPYNVVLAHFSRKKKRAAECRRNFNDEFSISRSPCAPQDHGRSLRRAYIYDISDATRNASKNCRNVIAQGRRHRISLQMPCFSLCCSSDLEKKADHSFAARIIPTPLTYLKALDRRCTRNL